jgi:hypothetical protein
MDEFDGLGGKSFVFHKDPFPGNNKASCGESANAQI